MPNAHVGSDAPPRHHKPHQLARHGNHHSNTGTVHSMAYHGLVIMAGKLAPPKQWPSQHPQDREQQDAQGHEYHHDDEDE